MTDPIGAAALSTAGRVLDPAADEAAKAASNLLTRLLGPSADVVGADWAERLRQRNLRRLLEKTQKREEAKPETGFAAPRLAVAAFDAAQYADDEIVAEYLSGVLASSRAEGGGDDGGVSWSALVARLSSVQLRLHYLIYASIRQAVIDSTPAHIGVVHGTEVILPLDDLTVALNLGERLKAQLADALDGLMREGLVGDGYTYGDVEFLEQNGRKYGDRLDLPYERGFKVKLTVHGIRLFLWGTGLGQGMADQYFDPSVSVALVDDIAGLTPVSPAAFYAKTWTAVGSPAVER